MLRKAGIGGLADSGPGVRAPTFRDGLLAIDLSTGEPAWSVQQYGGIYYAKRLDGSFLFGTAKGLVSVSDPTSVQYSGLDGNTVLSLLVDARNDAKLVTSAGTNNLSTPVSQDTSVQWPESDGAVVHNTRLSFDAHYVSLLTRYVNGLAVAGETAAVAQDQGITMLDRNGANRFTAIPAIAGSLAADGRHFLVGTATQGVQVLAADGRITGQLGTGRATVRTVRPGKTALLFWDGTILDSDANTLGRITWGNPRDAAFVQDRLAVLVTRPDRDPVVGLLEGDHWQPLEIPGLAEIGAEKIAATHEYLFAAGPRGGLRYIPRCAGRRSAAPDGVSMSFLRAGPAT